MARGGCIRLGCPFSLHYRSRGTVDWWTILRDPEVLITTRIDCTRPLLWDCGLSSARVVGVRLVYGTSFIPS